jgi:hypothetical protein
MNTAIFNRAANLTDGDWIHIVPKGELPNREAGIIQVLDQVALNSIMADLAKKKRQLGDRWSGLYGGEEHFLYPDDHSSQAFAWFKNLNCATMVSGFPRTDLLTLAEPH